LKKSWDHGRGKGRTVTTNWGVGWREAQPGYVFKLSMGKKAGKLGEEAILGRTNLGMAGSLEILRRERRGTACKRMLNNGTAAWVGANLSYREKILTCAITRGLKLGGKGSRPHRIDTTTSEDVPLQLVTATVG